MPISVITAVNNYNFQIDLQCPQCGAPAVLDETQNIIQCGFCRTNNIIHTDPYPCFFIRPKKNKYAHLPVAYVPYWRFKGLEFSMGPRSPGFRIIDQSYIAVNRPGLPMSLGFRTQTQRLEFIRKGIDGTFLVPDLTRKGIIERISGKGMKKVHIGEILSLIFFPFYHDRQMIYDGLTGESRPKNADTVESDKKSPSYHLKFTPSLCPECGWDLNGETDSLVLTCKNCMRFYLIHANRLNQISAGFFGQSRTSDILMPFWQFQIQFKTCSIESFTDFMNLANIPVTGSNNTPKGPLSFFIPAFKINPKLFLRIGRQVTSAQIQPDQLTKMPETYYHPADLALDEGFQAVPPVMMETGTNKKDVWAWLAKEKLKVRSFNIVYVGFRRLGSDYIQDDLGVSLPVNAMKFGRGL